MADIVMPQLGESVTEGTITKWFKGIGDHVAEDETLFEVSTDKVDSEVPSPSAGYVAEIRVPEGETVDVGTVLVGLSESPVGDGAAAPEAPGASPEPPAPSAPPVVEAPAPVAEAPAPVSEAPAAESAPEPEAADGGAAGDEAAGPGRLLSPLVRRLVEENNIDPSQITGTGLGGRITREDVLAVIDARAGGTPAAAPAAANSSSVACLSA